jgi:hypothetical protein
MTSATIKACSGLVNIGVTFIAFGFCFRKYQGRMALPAVYLGMLPDQWQFGCVMIKRINIFIDLPAFCTVTNPATDFKICTVRRRLPLRKVK